MLLPKHSLHLSRIVPCSLGALLFLLPLLCLPAAPLRAQEGGEKEALDVKQLSTELEKQYKDRRHRDVDRIKAILGMLEEGYKDLEPAEQKKVVKVIRKAFDVRPPLEDRSFLITAAGALASMGKPGFLALQSGLKGKALEVKDKKNTQALATCRRVKAFMIEAMGRTGQPEAIKPLCKFLWSDEMDIVKGALKGLALFKDLPLAKRKPIVQEVVKVYAYMDSQARQAIKNPKVSYLKDRLISTEVSFNQTLKALTLQSFESAPEWQKWYNDNKNKKKW